MSGYITPRCPVKQKTRWKQRVFLFVRQAWRVARERHLLDCGGQAVIWRCKSSSDPDGGNR
jgi:hypothetical protein